eukprot:TRINITY_DN2313_c0_g1_i3.p1 TRINITY_DN2313_c0_g1~~TRINITY_DN2313_c0_g1_i3.p1  ORF type:complete len:194 (-),score=28.38 TRINITY_DN2313_c0_g1_i3:144-725(-)
MPRQGDIIVKTYNGLNLVQSRTITGHINSICGIAMDYHGRRIATASEKGTLVRIYDLSDPRTPYKTVRRGTNPTTIRSMAFSSDGKELCVASDTGTIHLFSCGSTYDNPVSYFTLFGSTEELSSKQIYLEKAAIVTFGTPKGTEGSVMALEFTTASWYKFVYVADNSSSECKLAEKECLTNFLYDMSFSSFRR